MTTTEIRSTEEQSSAVVVAKITDYLTGGGLFNPELANHNAVRDLLIEARDELNRLREIEWMYRGLCK